MSNVADPGTLGWWCSGHGSSSILVSHLSGEVARFVINIRVLSDLHALVEVVIIQNIGMGETPMRYQLTWVGPFLTQPNVSIFEALLADHLPLEIWARPSQQPGHHGLWPSFVILAPAYFLFAYIENTADPQTLLDTLSPSAEEAP